MRTRLLIVDDNMQFVQAVSQLLQRQGAEVAGFATNGADALRLADSLQPDAILVDVELGPENGIDVATRLASEQQQRVVLISVHSETELSELIASTPALGFIPKTEISLPRIDRVLHGTGPAEA